MAEKKFVERRKYVRVDAETKVDFQVKETKEAPAKRVLGISKNISAEGICFTSDVKLEPGTKLKLEIHLPAESKSLHLEGEVRWSGPIQQEGKTVFDTGVKLSTIDKNDENRFLGYVCDKMTERLSRYLHL